jgi:hypothetical protein
MVLVCPQAIRDLFPDDPVPFGPGVADSAGLLAAGPAHWNSHWTCGSPLEFGKHSLSGFPPDNIPLLDADAQATPLAFEKVLLQHLCPPLNGPDDPVRLRSTGDRYDRHNLSPPCAVLVRASLVIAGQPSPPFYVVLGLPTVALDQAPLPGSLWTDSATNAATAPFQHEPGSPFLGTTAHSADALAPDHKFPSLDEWWSLASTWWSMSGATAFRPVISQSLVAPDLRQTHPSLEPLCAATLHALRDRLSHLQPEEYSLPAEPNDQAPALLLPTMLPLPPHHGLPIGQFFGADISVPALKTALTAMGLPTIPSWLDHPIVAAWFDLFSTPTAPPAIPFTPGTTVGPRLPSAMFRSREAGLHDASLIFANKMRHHCVWRLYPKTTRTQWSSYLRKAHPTTFETALPQLHALPPEHNPYLLMVRPSATGTWPIRYGYKDWDVTESRFPPYFRPYLRSRHLVRANEKDPPNLPLLTWDEEVAAREAEADSAATPLQSPDALASRRKKGPL